MAELAVLLAIKKIGHAVTAEAQRQISSRLSSEMELITQLPSSMKRIRREFVVMQAFLGDIDSESYDNTMQAWLEELRKIANDVEDVVDKFVYLLGDDRLNGLAGLFIKLTCRAKKILDWREVALKLKELESDLQHVTQIKDRWIKRDNIRDSLANTTEMQLPDLPDAFDDQELEGCKVNKDKLEKMLLADENYASSNHSLRHSNSLWERVWPKSREEDLRSIDNQSEAKPIQIIAVWGQSGIGKRTLVSNVCSSLKSKFDLHASVPVPLNGNSEELLRSLVKKLQTNDAKLGDRDNMPTSERLKRIISKKKVLIFLDDVRAPLDTQITSALVSHCTGSKVVVTTQSQDIAGRVDSMFRLQVEPLKRNDAKSLLLKKAFPKDNQTDFPPELENAADKIIEYCDGLPSAIASVGVLLSQRERLKSEWEKVSDQFRWLVEHNESFSRPKIAFELGLKYLPKYLKNCYLLCSIFPKGFVFKRKRLIRLWVAEGFVEKRGNSLMEEVAEDYLNELVNLCMFEVVEKNVNGRLKRFKMQAFKQEILMLISKREHFSMLCTNLEKLNRNYDVRHLCLHKCSNIYDVDMPQLRSFMVLEGDISYQSLSSVFDNSRYLTVLDLQKTTIDRIPDSIGNLFNLQYLNLRKTKVKKLPKSIGELKNLQTLDVIYTDIEELPREITKLKKLRHLFVGKELDQSEASFDGVRTTARFHSMKYLQTLHGIDASNEFVEDLQYLTLLRSLSITKVKQSHTKDLFSSLSKLPMLLKLDIAALNEKEQLNLTGLEALKSVEKLKLHGHVVEAAAMSSLGFLSKNLTSLYLSCTGLKDDKFMDCLIKLQGLASLKLSNASSCERLHFTAEAFPNLKKLCLRDMESLQKIIFDETAVKSLKFLELRNLKNLKELPKNMEHKIQLRGVHLLYLHQEFPEAQTRRMFSQLSDFKYDGPHTETPRTDKKKPPNSNRIFSWLTKSK